MAPPLVNNPSLLQPGAQDNSSSVAKPRAVFFEIFAGCGQLSLSMKSKGFLVVPVDYHFNKHDIRVELMSLDLTTDEGQSCLMGLLKQLQPAVIHVALPCGTGSRARERPIASHLIAKGAPQPRPLRDADHVPGLPGLSSRDSQRVALSNRLASFTVQLLIFAMETFCFISIENPVRSWMFAVLAHYVRAMDNRALSKFWNEMVPVDFANCAHGGERDKKTRFLRSSDMVIKLALSCPGNHTHTNHLDCILDLKDGYSTLQSKVSIPNFCVTVMQLSVLQPWTTLFPSKSRGLVSIGCNQNAVHP